MEIELTAIRIDRPLTEEEAAKLLLFLPAERRERLSRLGDPALAHEPICAYAALRLGLYERFGWQELPTLSYNAHGKPYFAEHPEVHFNLSHTRGAVLVGIHDRPLGVDIERIRPVSGRMMQYLAGATSERAFFERWTRRESRVKLEGMGLAAMRGREPLPMHGERFVYPEIFSDCIACLCTRAEDALAPIRRYTLSSLI